MTFRPPRVDLLALFPSFDSAHFGGIQATGRQAWEGIGTRKMTASAFFYTSGAPKLPSVMRAVRNRTTPNTILVWHCGLLKLTPFIASSWNRLVVFLHGIEAWRGHDPLTNRMLRGTTLFLSNSDHTWKRFLEFHPECAGAPHRTVHLGTGAALAGRTPDPDSRPAALMIGRLQKDEAYKGHREMIEIWPTVMKAVPDAQLWIAGGGDLGPELKELAGSLGLTDGPEPSVRFFGAVPEETKQDLLRRCRLLALPSAGEGFGLVYLEAMRMGRPCIVSRVDAGAEVVNPPEAGLAVDLSKPAETAAAVRRLLTPGADWDRMAAAARCRYESRFTAAHYEQRLLGSLWPEVPPVVLVPCNQ